MPEISDSRYMVQAGWDDVPRLDRYDRPGMLSVVAKFARLRTSTAGTGAAIGAVTLMASS